MPDRKFEKLLPATNTWEQVKFEDLFVGDVCRAFEADGTPVKHPGNGTLWRVTEVKDFNTVMAEGLA